MGKRLEHKTKKPDLVSIFTGALLCVYVIGLVTPIIWAVMTSLTEISSYDNFYLFQEYPDGFPFTFTLDNFVVAWNNLSVTAANTMIEYNVLGLYIHSVKFALYSALSFTFCTAMVSYLTAKFDFRFSGILYAFVILAMSLPIVGSMPSEIRMLENLGIYGQWISVPILRFNFLSVYYLVLHATYRGVSKEYSEAAKIDGASNLRIMLRIVMPQAMNIIVTIFVLTFIGYWNDYQVPMVYMPDYPVAAYGVYQFMRIPQDGGLTSNMAVQMAGTILMALPILIVVAVFNKRLRVSVSIGGVKG
ncbi:MAG: carbohydrate ABC transporter permease [Oscillospiraceae bacterium]|nr:carbohydrate ABC transporter permease [Oscillospiraceae bacterium]